MHRLTKLNKVESCRSTNANLKRQALTDQEFRNRLEGLAEGWIYLGEASVVRDRKQMANYFSNIPNVHYDINGTEPNHLRSVTNIMQRVRFKPSVLKI